MTEVMWRLTVLGPFLPSTREAAVGPARSFQVPGFRGELGFITPMSQHHCRTCNRLRLTADGKLHTCLLDFAEIGLKGLCAWVWGRICGYPHILFQNAMGGKAGKAGESWPVLRHPGRALVSIGG